MNIECVTLTESASGATAKILVGLGFNCYSFTSLHGGRPVEALWAAPGFELGAQRAASSGIPVLFPFPGRIQGAAFQWENRTYRLPEADGRGNAIHGFVHERPWRVVEQSDHRVAGQYQASVDDPSLLKQWPADFRISAVYELRGNTLCAAYTIENPDDHSLPYGLGTHPYFRVPLGGSSAADCVVQLPVSERWELRDLIPTGKRQPLNDREIYSQGISFGEMDFDDVFGDLAVEQKQCKMSLRDPGSGRVLTMSFDDAFRACVVYTPPHREAICIEPYTCVPNAIQLRQHGIDSGLRELPPGSSFSAAVTIRVD